MFNVEFHSKHVQQDQQSFVNGLILPLVKREMENWSFNFKVERNWKRRKIGIKENGEKSFSQLDENLRTSIVGKNVYFYIANDIRNSIFCVTSAVKSRFFIFSSCHDMFADIETKHTFSRLGWMIGYRESSLISTGIIMHDLIFWNLYSIRQSTRFEARI